MNVELLITEPLTIKHPSKLGREMLTTCKVKDNSIKEEIIFSSENVTICEEIASLYVGVGGVLHHLSHGKNLFLIFSQWFFCFIANGSISSSMICWIGFLLSPCPVLLVIPCRLSAPLAITGIYTTPQKVMLLL